MLDVDQARELKAAFRRTRGSNGSLWTNETIKRFSEGDFLGYVLDVLEGRAKIVSTSPEPEAEPIPPQAVTIPRHLYEFRIQKDGADAVTLITQTRQTFFVSEYAEAMANNANEFVVGPKEEVVIRVFTAESLGVNGWSETDFFGPKGFEHVKQFGLRECLADDAFGIRAVHSEQKLDELIRVAHKPISARGSSSVFRVGHGRDRGRYVYGYVLDSRYGLGSDILVALRVAISPQTSVTMVS